MFKVHKTHIEKLLVIEANKIIDGRGYFVKKYLSSYFKNIGMLDIVAEEIISKSKFGTIRGLHFQTKNPQAKLISIINGRILDVAVDLRRGSLTYGEHFSIELSSQSNFMLFIPAGFAHGFLALEEDSIVSYLCSTEYEPDYDSGLIFNDPDLNIHWTSLDCDYTISDKDKSLPRFQDFSGFK